VNATSLEKVWVSDIGKSPEVKIDGNPGGGEPPSAATQNDPFRNLNNLAD
jgi:hypothetical protein